MSKDSITFITYDAEDNEVEHTVPSKFEVCSGCNGKGSHVNPAVDGDGISAEEMYEDPDFAEEYFGGTYDIQCQTCNGLRVELVADWEGVWPTGLKEMYEEHLKEEWSNEQERAVERMMGA